MVGRDLPDFNAALDIASVLMKSVQVIAKKEKEGRKSMDSDFFKLCRKISFISHPQQIEVDSTAAVENVEVYSSFRPSVSATISAEKLEQIVLSSESDSEPEETGGCQAEPIKKGVSGTWVKIDECEIELVEVIAEDISPRILSLRGNRLRIGLRNQTAGSKTSTPDILNDPTSTPPSGPLVHIQDMPVPD